MMEHYRLSQGLDFYKPTMSQFVYEKAPDDIVTFTLKNRNADPLSAYVSAEHLREYFDMIRERGWSPEEIAYLASLTAQNGDARFTEDYLDHLSDMKLPPLTIEQNDDIHISASGKWSDVSFWETIIMSELNELYYQKKCQAEGLSLDELYREGDRRLGQKIEELKQHPEIKIADFGTRRRFSADWHHHVFDRLMGECPENVIGTSNVWFAHEFDVAPIGTFAHELPMVYAAMSEITGDNPLSGHKRLLEEWYERYGKDLSIALTDTFGSAFFFTDFTPEMALQWRGLRHDSGDPITFGERVVDFYLSQGIDPMSKTLVFSDGLDIDQILLLNEKFFGRIKLVFGWGTTLTNDLGLPANNFVMKATSVNGTDTVKLSDVAGKHTGSETAIQRYLSAVALRTQEVMV